MNSVVLTQLLGRDRPNIWITIRWLEYSEYALEFGQMLKATLDKMAEKVEVTSDWAVDSKEEPIVRTFEDFNLGLQQ